MTARQAGAMASPMKGLSPVRQSESHPMGQVHSPDQQGTITGTGMAAE